MQLGNVLFGKNCDSFRADLHQREERQGQALLSAQLIRIEELIQKYLEKTCILEEKIDFLHQAFIELKDMMLKTCVEPALETTFFDGECVGLPILIIINEK